MMNAISIIDRIDDGNRERERELTALLYPIDSRLTVTIFNKGVFGYEVAVGRDGLVTHQPGTRFNFGINRLNLRPYVGSEEFCLDFEDDFETCMEWLRQGVARMIWNYFHDRPDRVLKAVDPIKAHNKEIEWKRRNDESLARKCA